MVIKAAAVEAENGRQARTIAGNAPQQRAKAPRRKKEGGRLAMEDWILAALDMLDEKGIEGVRVELLARKLEVTKGSFYWHFKDRDALHAAILDHWRRRATLNLIERLNQDTAPRERLLRLLRLPYVGPKSERAAAVELSIRLWSRTDDRANRALIEIDELRIQYISQLLTECGVPGQDVRPRAILAYAYIRVGSSLVVREDADVVAVCERLLLPES